MKNIQSSQCCAPKRTDNQKSPTLILGGGVALFPFTFLLLLAMWCFVPDASGAASTFSFTGAKMDNVYQGLNVRGNITPFISACQYSNIPPQEDIKSGTPAGVFTKSTQGITLSANQFDSDAGYISYGAIINNSLGTGGATVEFNTFTDFNIANQFEEDNASLQTHCNTYQGGVGDVSWNVMGVFPDQASPFDASYFPDNSFVWDCGTPLLDIRSNPTFTYYERKQTGQNSGSILLCYTEPEVTKLEGEFQSPIPNCIIEDPCPNPPYCNSLMVKYNTSGSALPYRNELLNAYVRMSPDAVADSLYLPGTARAIALLTNRNQQEDKRILAATYASLGNYITAQQYLQQITGASTETLDFIAYYTVLINAGLAGRDAYHLTTAEFAQIAPLMTHNSTVAVNAKVLDHVLNGVYHPLEAESGTGGRPGGERSAETDETLTSEGLRVQPNPFESEVRFFAPEGTVIKTLSIIDVSGRVVYSERFGEGQSMLMVNTASMPQGVLFYQCQLSGGETLHG
ncbi:MAG: T9SS type A sorting domain-containing protein, partial [Saprospiraceae bacterium]|nr:T9SS type A sorting domain-containing protein [Saprospiraceae bacterium]